jgi:hypothetical protein
MSRHDLQWMLPEGWHVFKTSVATNCEMAKRRKKAAVGPFLSAINELSDQYTELQDTLTS